MLGIVVVTIASLQWGLGLDCYHGRKFDQDMKKNVAGFAFEDEIEIRHCSLNETCCIRLAVSKCCTLEARKYSIADGSCASAAICERAERRNEFCQNYDADECRHHVCHSHLCNDLSMFDSRNAAMRIQPEMILLLVVCIVALQIIFFYYLFTKTSTRLHTKPVVPLNNLLL